MALLTRELTTALDRVGPLDDLAEELGRPPRIVTEYAQPQGYWVEGDPPPPIVAVGPAEAQAIGRCAFARAASGQRFSPLGLAIHHASCDWCALPLDELLAACDHATWLSRYVVSEFATWAFDNGVYMRPTSRSDTYDNPRWARYFAALRPSR